MLGFVISRASTRVVDWFVMTDELLYERLALSIAHSGSPLPRVHGVLIPNLNQLYPLLLAGPFAHGEVPGSLHEAHLLNAFLMSSAALPAYLIARRATGSRLVSYLVALGTVCVPWIVYSSFLLTEVVGYPAFLWAVLGIQVTIVAPSRRNDTLALLGVALAVFARTQFIVLLLVLPASLLAYDLATANGAPRRRRVTDTARTSLARHRTIAVVYAFLIVGGIALLAVGRVTAILGTYADTVTGNVLPGGIGRSLLTHLAVLALSLAILPFLVASGWLIATTLRPEPGERFAFALLALVTIAALWIQVTIFDLRFGGGVVRDRYLFYVVPLLLVACACGLQQGAWRRRWILPPAALATAGFLVAGLPVFGTLDVDTPVSDIDGYLRTSVHSLEGARLLLAGATVIAAIVYLQLSSLLPRSLLIALVVVVVGVALPAETWYAYATLFRHPGTSGRPLTLQQGGVFDWVDSKLGTRPDVTMLPYPYAPGDFQASLAYWWDLEFWNESVGHAAYYPGEFNGTPSTFPPLALHFDPETGVANISPSEYAVELRDESRFRLYGTVLNFDRSAFLIDTGGSWRADWVSFGLDDDGWTAPGVEAQVRVFPTPDQTAPGLGTLTLRFGTLTQARPVAVNSNAGAWRGTVPAGATRVVNVPVCQPAKGFTDVRLDAQGESVIYGDMRNINTFGSYRTGGVLVESIQFSRGTAPCSPSR